MAVFWDVGPRKPIKHLNQEHCNFNQVPSEYKLYVILHHPTQLKTSLNWRTCNKILISFINISGNTLIILTNYFYDYINLFTQTLIAV
jgi:hypothetical protein